MSGHSKWATTKRQKAAVDAKRSSLFTKFSKNISIAARDGADSTSNFKLRIAIDQARAVSMPKDNIERAIARGSGGSGGAQLEHILYEGYGPEGLALIIETITDNKNRTISEVKHYFSKNGGNLAGNGSVSWMFDERGVITVSDKALSEEQELALIDHGLLDVRKNEGITLITERGKLQEAKEAAEALGLSVGEASLAYMPKDAVVPKDSERLTSFLDGLDDLDDVNTIYTNADI